MSLIYPALAQILWTFVVMMMAVRARIGALKHRSVTMGQIALSNEGWPAAARAAGNNMNNQFETPVLFYALIGVAVYIGAIGTGMTALAWLYVITRVGHTLVHVNGNNVLMRFRVFALGVFTLMAMWCGIVLKLIGLN